MFRYKTKRKDYVRLPTARPATVREAEQLAGEFNGIEATDDEERFGRALRSHPDVREIYFRMSLGPARYMPGWLELDFLANTIYRWRAFEIDDMEFVHRGERERQEAMLKDLKRREYLSEMGIAVQEIEHVDAAKLQSRDEAKHLVELIL